MAIKNNGEGKLFITVDNLTLDRPLTSLEDVDMVESAISKHIDLPYEIVLEDGSILKLNTDIFVNFSVISEEVVNE